MDLLTVSMVVDLTAGGSSRVYTRSAFIRDASNFSCHSGTPHVAQKAPGVLGQRERTLVMALIETAAGIANPKALIAVNGVEFGRLGHFDLTTSTGIPGQFAHTDFLAALRPAGHYLPLSGRASRMVTGFGRNRRVVASYSLYPKI
jgi:hypothetical protein